MQSNLEHPAKFMSYVTLFNFLFSNFRLEIERMIRILNVRVMIHTFKGIIKKTLNKIFNEILHCH